MIEIQSYCLGALETNCYILSDPATNQAIIIDPAEDGDFISQQIVEKNLNLSAILLTHGHFDHVLGLLSITLNFPDVRVFLHSNDHFLIKEAQKSASHWLSYSPDPVPMPKGVITHDQQFLLGATLLRTIETPGHTPGSVSFYIEKSDFVFTDNQQQLTTQQSPILICGDTIFYQAVGRTDFSYSSPFDLEKSIIKIDKLPSHTFCLPGHGRPFLLNQR